MTAARADESTQAVTLRETAQIVEIIVIGMAQSGKSAFINTISHATVWDGAEANSWLSGQLTVDDALTVYFLEPPPMKEFDFMWLRELVSESSASGYIVLIDSTQSEYFGKSLSILQTIRSYHPTVPVVVAVTKQDVDGCWGSEDIRLGLRIPDNIPTLPCNTGDIESVKEVVLQLLYLVPGL